MCLCFGFLFGVFQRGKFHLCANTNPTNANCFAAFLIVTTPAVSIGCETEFALHEARFWWIPIMDVTSVRLP